MVENSSWHGTGVAVIAATGNNGIGNAGLDRPRIQAARVLGKCGA